MRTYGLNSADYIKGKVIDFYIVRNHNVIVGSEIMYGTERRVVDLILLENNKITAIEIKSDNDNLKRINHQINEYKKIFNFVVLFVTSKHLNKVLETTPKDVGVFLIDASLLIIQIRPPKIQRKLIKEEILYSINSKYLRRISAPTFNTLKADEIRKHYTKRVISFIVEIFYNYLEEKIKPNFILFLLERGTETHIEDLSLLTLHRDSVC